MGFPINDIFMPSMPSKEYQERNEIIMNVLLVFFALPFAVIVISIALEKILDCPILVASVIFSILLIIAILLSSSIFFILVVIYTILAFLAAWISKYICRFIRNIRNCNTCNNENRDESNDGNTITVNGRVRLLDSNNNCNNQTNNANNINNTGTFCGCFRRR